MKARRAFGFMAVVTSVFVLGVLARAVESSVRVQALYNSDALVTNFLLPFKLSGLQQPSDLVAFRVLGVPDKCGLMQDLFRKEIFLLKCDRPAAPVLEFTVNNSGVRQMVRFGPVAVNGADGVAAPTPTPTPTPTPIPGSGAAGKTVFNTYCTGCHASAAGLGAPSASRIREKLGSVPSMRSLESVLSDADINNLATYLANPGAY